MTKNNDLKEKLAIILREFKEANEAEKDTQTEVSANNAGAQPSSGAKQEPKTVAQDEGTKAYVEKEVKKNVTEGNVTSTANDPNVGAEAEPDKARQDNPEAYKEKENSETPENGEKNEERLKEMEGDIAVLVEVLEQLKNRIEALEAKINNNEEAKNEEKAEEPLPPVMEKLTLGHAFSKERNQKFVEAVNSIMLRK